MMKIVKIVLPVLLLTGIAGYYWQDDDVKQEYVTQKLQKGDITEKVTASGIINPISTVNIGTQVSGTIAEIFVDYNSKVTKDQLLARIDPALFEATVAQRAAALNIAKAEVEVVKNDIVYYKKHLDRVKKLNSSQ